jgi:hypothetical protein
MKIIIHLGYPKAWSKFLQKFLFENCNLYYLNISKKDFYLDYLELRDFMKFSSDQEFDAKIEFYRGKINKYFKNEEINLYSDEFFLCPSNYGFKIIFRLIKFFSYNNNDLDFVIFTRKQNELINSYYCQNSDEFKDLNPLYNDYLYLVNFFRGREASKTEKNFFKIWSFKKIEKLIFKLNKKKPYLIKCENLSNKNKDTLVLLSKIFKIPSDKIFSILNEKKHHSSDKDQNKVAVKRFTRIVIKYPFMRIFLKYFSMEFKLKIKNILEKLTKKKFIITSKEFNKIIDTYYK